MTGMNGFYSPKILQKYKFINHAGIRMALKLWNLITIYAFWIFATEFYILEQGMNTAYYLLKFDLRETLETI